MNAARTYAAVAIAAAALTAAMAAPATAHAAKKSSRPTVGAWHTETSVTYYATGKYKVSDHGRKLSHMVFRPNAGVTICPAGKYTVPGSFAIRKGGAKGYGFHIGQRVKGSDVYQVDKVAYKIDGKKQPTTTSLEIEFKARHAHVEFGPYGTASCNLFWDATPT
jgi:hypothetical protein